MLSCTKKLTLIILLLLCGCATMDKSECLTADWYLIGMEDGARGRELSHIGEHRKACAGYQISPDLSRYQSGHTLGLRQYCTYSKGFQLGQQGGSLKDVCPPELAAKHLTGFQRGQRIYKLNQDLNRISGALRTTLDHLADLDAETLHNEDLIISSRTTEIERTLLLARNKEIHLKVLDLEERIIRLEDRQAVKLQKRNQLVKRFQAGPD